jgi:putative tryptophan/tyrosine transport system substrate-binding protein
MRRRDLTIGLALTAGVRAARAQEPAKPHRIAMIRSAGPVALMSDAGLRNWRAFFEELRRLGDVEGQNLVVERYSGDGHPERYADIAREIIDRNPELIVAATNPIALAVRAATDTIPIVWIGVEPILLGFATSLAHPGGNITGVSVQVEAEIWGKRLQILKQAAPSVSKVAFLTMQTSYGLTVDLQKIGQPLQVSLRDVALLESTPSEYQRAFADIAKQRPDGILVSDIGDLIAFRQLIVDFAVKNRLPTIYPWRDYVEVGGLMAYESDPGELGRRMADDVHQILNGAKPGDIPIYQPTKFQFIVNLNGAKALDLTLPQSLLALADEVIE